MTDTRYATQPEQYEVSSDGSGALEAQAQAFSDLSRTLAQAVEQARLQASDLIGGAQEHARSIVTRADRRAAEGLRHATDAERRTAAAQTRLVGLESRIEQAEAKLADIGVRAHEIALLVTSVEVPSAQDEPLGTTWDAQLAHAEHDGPTPARGDDFGSLAALASLRDTVDASA